MKTIVEKMAAYTAALKYEDLPESVVRKLKVCISDAVENCLTELSDNRTESALRSIIKDDRFPATIIGTNMKASAEDAAFYNTLKGAVTSRNDSSRTAICHPGSILIPVVFALGEEEKKDGKTVLCALASGYETMIRLGTCFVKSGINNSWRKTAITAPFGAAFAAARMMAMDEKGTASAASFSCHAAGGVNEWAVAGTGEDIFQNGWGARNGISAMRLARGGAEGCPTILEGKSGLLSAFEAGEVEELSPDTLGSDYRLLEIMFKPIDCCFIVQGACQTAKDVSDKIPSSYPFSSIKSVEVRMPRQAIEYPGCNNTESINSLVQGIMSIALGVCSTLYNKSTEHLQWAPPINEEIISLMHRTKLVIDEEKTAAFPSLQGSYVKVVMTDGTVFEADHRDVKPLTDEEVYNKFHETTLRRLGKEKAEKLDYLIQNIEDVKDIHEITNLLRIE